MRFVHPVSAGGASLRQEPLRAPINRNQRLVLDELESAARPLKAYDLLERLRDRGVNAPMTVYRALDGLIAAGRVRKIASLNAFLATSLAGGAVMICRRCGRAIERPVPKGLARELFGDAGMVIESTLIEAQGWCGCAPAPNRNASPQNGCPPPAPAR